MVRMLKLLVLHLFLLSDGSVTASSSSASSGTTFRPSKNSGIIKPKSALNPLHKIRAGSTITQKSSEKIPAQLILAYNQTSVQIGSSDLPSILGQLATSSNDGLTSDQALQRISQYGPNKLESPPSKSLWRLILEQFDDKLVQILLGVAVISGIFSYMELRAHTLITGEKQHFLKSFMEPIIILAILILNAAVGVWQSQQAEGSLEALKKNQPSFTSVLSDGKWFDGVNAAQLVPGDIIKIRVGDKVPADARLLILDSIVLSLDEGSLTRESMTVGKLPGNEGVCLPGAPVQDMHGVIFSGTVCTAGSAIAVVVRTGMGTEMGKIQKGVTEAKGEEHKTPLGIKLDEFGAQLTKIISVICLAVWLISIPKFSDPTFKNSLEGAIYYAKVAVALGVAAIPEGLPAVITLCLSLGTRRMAKKNVIVRKLPSVETLGCTR